MAAPNEASTQKVPDIVPTGNPLPTPNEGGVDEIVSTLSAFENIPGVDLNMIEALANGNNPQPPAAQQQPPVTPAAGDPPPATEPASPGAQPPVTPAAGDPPPETAPATGEGEYKSVLFAGKGKSEPVEVEDLGGLVEVANKKYGMNLAGPEELDKLFEMVDTHRANAKTFGEKAALYDSVLEGYENMPAPLLSAIEAYGNGQDWKGPLKLAVQHNIDYTQEVDAIGSKALVKFFYPNKFSEEDFSAEEKSDALQMAEELAVQQFNINKQQLARQVQTATDRESTRLLNLKSSGKASADIFEAKYSGLDPNVANKVRGTLTQEGLTKVFFDDKGMLRKEAAERLFFALYGADEVAAAKNAATANAETKKNKGAAAKGKDRPSVKGKGGAGTETAGALDDIMKLVTGTVKTQTY